MFITGRRYRAPDNDGDKLIDPPLADVQELLQAAERFDLPNHSLDGRSLSQLRALARHEVLELLGLQTNPTAWFVAGHQPELFHPGVWLKNFVLGHLAGHHDGIAINLIVDNDVQKSPAVRIPVWRPGIAANDVTIATLPFDLPSRDLPFEEWRVRDHSLWASFPQRLNDATRYWPVRPIGVPGWDSQATNICEALTKLRQFQERRWGLNNAELAVSKLCTTNAFAHFVNTIIHSLSRFHGSYNSAVRQHRTTYRIKSRHHPVPDLATDGDWLEAPFWCWTSDEPRRQRPFLRQTANGIRVRWGQRESAWPDNRMKLRPRALTLTLFVRLALADMFIHGIGGGKYDELTDAISASFFGAAPPTFMVVSGTLRLGLPAFRSTNAEWLKSQRQARDLLWNPQRVVSSPDLAAERARILDLPRGTRIERRERCAQLRRNLARWQNHIASELTQANVRLQQLDSEARANDILGSREWPWVLYPERRLEEWLQRAAE